MRWVGRFLSSGARRRCCVIVTRAAVLVSDAARLQCLPGCPAMHQLSCSLWPRASASASTPARPSPHLSDIRVRLYPVRISVGISFPRCLARCAPSILSTLLRQYFSLNCRRPPLDQGGWSSESVSHGCIGHDTEADWHQSAPGTPERRLLALEVILD